MGNEAWWALEERFWTSGPEFYEAHLASEAVMVFPPPTGVLRRPGILESVRRAPRWQKVEMRDRQQARPREDTVALAYRAVAERESGRPYRAICGSVYTRTADGWQLMLHQQAPMAAG